MTGATKQTRRPGRRPGANETREAILVAARDAFAAHGYEKATIRGIAREAGVDPALVHHFYGPKEEVFRAAVSDVLAPIAAAMADVGREVDAATTGRRLARVLVELWEREPTRGALIGAVRAAVTSDTAAELVRGIVQEHAIATVAAGTDAPDAELRANLVGATIVGVSMARHVLGVEPIASLSEDELAGVLGGALGYYLSAELGAGGSPTDRATDAQPAIGPSRGSRS
jgi:AcrR family transcriptional regulator